MRPCPRLVLSDNIFQVENHPLMTVQKKKEALYRTKEETSYVITGCALGSIRRVMCALLLIIFDNTLFFGLHGHFLSASRFTFFSQITEERRLHDSHYV